MSLYQISPIDFQKHRMNLINLIRNSKDRRQRKRTYICSEISKELVSREFKFDKLEDIIEAAQRYKHHVMPISVTKNISKPYSKVQTDAFITENNYKPPGKYSNNQQRNRSFHRSNVASNDQWLNRKFDSK